MKGLYILLGATVILLSGAVLTRNIISFNIMMAAIIAISTIIGISRGMKLEVMGGILFATGMVFLTLHLSDPKNIYGLAMGNWCCGLFPWYIMAAYFFANFQPKIPNFLYKMNTGEMRMLAYVMTALASYLAYTMYGFMGTTYWCVYSWIFAIAVLAILSTHTRFEEK